MKSRVGIKREKPGTGLAWYRVDNRLIHGQVIEGWLPYTGASFLAVANDSLAEDETRQLIMMLAVPNRIKVVFMPVLEVPAFMARQADKKEKTMVLFSTCEDVCRAYDAGTAIEVFNIGNLHYSEGKQQICAHIALSAEDKICLAYLEEQGVNLDFRCVPNDAAQYGDRLGKLHGLPPESQNGS